MTDTTDIDVGEATVGHTAEPDRRGTLDIAERALSKIVARAALDHLALADDPTVSVDRTAEQLHAHIELDLVPTGPIARTVDDFRDRLREQLAHDTGHDLRRLDVRIRRIAAAPPPARVQ